jgi:hypothetical protein
MGVLGVGLPPVSKLLDSDWRVGAPRSGLRAGSVQVSGHGPRNREGGVESGTSSDKQLVFDLPHCATRRVQTAI